MSDVTCMWLRHWLQIPNTGFLVTWLIVAGDTKRNTLSSQMSRDMTKPTKWVCAQLRLRSAWAFAQSEQSSLSAWGKLGSLATHWVHSEDSDQTGRMPRLICVFAGPTHFVCFVMSRLKWTWSSNLWLSFNGMKFFLAPIFRTLLCHSLE